MNHPVAGAGMGIASTLPAVGDTLAQSYPSRPIRMIVAWGRFLQAPAFRPGQELYADHPARFGSPRTDHQSWIASQVRDAAHRPRPKPSRKLNYATVGSGSPAHVSAELLQIVARIKIVHIPYKSGGAMSTAMLRNKAHLGFLAIAPAGAKSIAQTSMIVAVNVRA